MTILATRLDGGQLPRGSGREGVGGWERSGRRIGSGGGGGGAPTPSGPRRGAAGPAEAAAPGHARSLDRSSPGRRKTRVRAHKAAVVQAAAGGLRPSPGRAAAGSSPLTRPGGSRPPTSPARSAVSRRPATPRAGAVTLNEAAARGTKSRSPPSRRLARAPS